MEQILKEIDNMKYTIKTDSVIINKSFDSIDEAFRFGKALDQSFGIHEYENEWTNPVASIHYSPIKESGSEPTILFG
jgi:hypothetical protein